jgi:hypothetical protein
VAQECEQGFENECRSLETNVEGEYELRTRLGAEKCEQKVENGEGR